MEENENKEIPKEEEKNAGYEPDGFWEDRNVPNPSNHPPMSEGAAVSMPRGRKIALAVGAVVLALLFFLIGWLSHYYSLSQEERTLLWIFDRVENDYYKKLTDEEREAYYDGIFDAAMPDIFSTYFTPEEFRKLQTEREGSNADTGFSVFTDGEDLRVFLVQGNSPAELAGLKSGMKIYRFGKDADSLRSGNYEDLVAFVRSNRGSFCMECGYSEEDKAVYADLESKEYLASYCSYADSESSFAFRTKTDDRGRQTLALTDTGVPMSGLDEKTAYLRFSEFGGNAAEELVICLKNMRDRGRKNLILDLRCNGGGYLEILQSVCAHLLRNAEGSNPVVATAKYRSGRKTEFRATGNDFSQYFAADSKITVLADENSASASECLIGALIDYGTIGYDDIYLRNDAPGTGRSYGKGVMQSAYLAANGGGLRLTSAEIFWPKGKSIHGVGVTEAGDHANGITAPMVRGAEDAFLTQLFARLF